MAVFQHGSLDEKREASGRRDPGARALTTPRAEQTARDSNAKVAVIIVNWNASKDALDLLDQLDAVEGPELEYVVVDNDSTDDSVAVMRAARPELNLLEAGGNPGFAGGTVVGIRKAVEDPRVGFVLVLNSDIRVDPGFLPPLLEACRDPAGVMPSMREACPSVAGRCRSSFWRSSVDSPEMPA